MDKLQIALDALNKIAARWAGIEDDCLSEEASIAMGALRTIQVTKDGSEDARSRQVVTEPPQGDSSRVADNREVNGLQCEGEQPPQRSAVTTASKIEQAALAWRAAGGTFRQFCDQWNEVALKLERLEQSKYGTFYTRECGHHDYREGLPCRVCPAPTQTISQEGDENG